MGAHDGQVPAPRRALSRLRRPAAAESFLAPDESTPRVADLSALIADIDALRLTLQTDLTLAAAALEAGADGLAGELVDSDLGEVRAFGARAADRLTHLEASDEPADVAGDEIEAVAAEAVPPLRRRRIMSAAPLMAAAAALIGFVAFVPERGTPAPAPESTFSSAMLAGYELNRLARSGAPDEQLLLAAEELNDELARLIALADEDPAAAQQALLLLESTTAVLSSQGDSGVLRGVMAETRALRERLREALPVVAARPSRPLRTVPRTVAPALPRIVEQPEKERASSSSSSSSPAPQASPSAAPSSQPTAAPAPASPAPTPSPTPAGEPSPEPSEDSPLLQRGDSDGPFLLPGTVAGW